MEWLKTYKRGGYSLGLGQIRGIENLADTLLAFAFSKHESDGGCVGQHVPSCWFLRIRYENSSTRISNNCIQHYKCQKITDLLQI